MAEPGYSRRGGLAVWDKVPPESRGAGSVAKPQQNKGLMAKPQKLNSFAYLTANVGPSILHIFCKFNAFWPRWWPSPKTEGPTLNLPLQTSSLSRLHGIRIKLTLTTQ